MSGVAHSMVLSRPDDRYFSLKREAVDVQVLAVSSPPRGFVRSAASLGFTEVGGVRVYNPSPGAADVDVIIDTPRGSYIAENLFVGPGGQDAANVFPITEGESIRAVLRSTSAPDAEVTVQAGYGDADTFSKSVVPLVTDEYVTVISGQVGRVIPLFAMGVEVDAGVDMDFDMRVRQPDDSVVSIGFALGFNSGFVTQVFGLPPILREGQSLEVRMVAGSGNFIVMPMVPAPEFRGRP